MRYSTACKVGTQQCQHSMWAEDQKQVHQLEWPKCPIDGKKEKFGGGGGGGGGVSGVFFFFSPLAIYTVS